MSKKEKILEMTIKLLSNCENDVYLREKASAFTRKRRLGAKKILFLLLGRILRSLQISIDQFYQRIDEIPVSKQAFSKARMGLNPEYVRKFADGISEINAQAKDMSTYLGMRLIAMDGMDIALENTPALKGHFGCSGSKKDAATALASVAFDPLNQAIYDCQIAPYNTDERTLAMLHMERLTELGLMGSLLLFDRGYPSKEFILHTINSGFHFVMRVRGKWNLEVDKVKTQGYVTLTSRGESFRVRVLKVKLPTGEIETLLTDLNQKQLPIKKAGALYFKRWGIEVAYDTLKSKLQLENFSGKTVISVMQDFYATIYLAGFANECAMDATVQIQHIDSAKSLTYKRKANLNRTISKLRDHFIFLLLEPDFSLRHVMLSNLCEDVALRPESIRPGRSPIRKFPRNKRFPMAKKGV